METGHTSSHMWKKKLKENSDVLESIFNRVGPIRGKREVEFHCDFPDRASALEARNLLANRFPPCENRHVYSLRASETHKCKVVDKIEITSNEMIISELCEPLGGSEVYWEFDSTNFSA